MSTEHEAPARQALLRQLRGALVRAAGPRLAVPDPWTPSSADVEMATAALYDRFIKLLGAPVSSQVRLAAHELGQVVAAAEGAAELDAALVADIEGAAWRCTWRALPGGRAEGER